MTNCPQCGAAATVHITWPTSGAPQHADLCDTCAHKWWDTYKHTASGQCAQFSPVQEITPCNTDQ